MCTGGWDVPADRTVQDASAGHLLPYRPAVSRRGFTNYSEEKNCSRFYISFFKLGLLLVFNTLDQIYTVCIPQL